MRIETWNILLNALIGVLVVAYGVWLRNVVRQQLASKDSTIENLGAAIKANESEIARLRGETAPAIADSYKRMKDFADNLAAESNDLAARLKESEQTKPVADIYLERLSGHAEGFNDATLTFGKRLTELLQGPPRPNLVTGHQLAGVIASTMQDWATRSNELLKSLNDAKRK